MGALWYKKRINAIVTGETLRTPCGISKREDLFVVSILVERIR